jgi:flavin-dependent dehydrogenase
MIRPVTIAGGGLAGLSLGIALLERGVEVTLHDAGSYPKHRVCGEFLSGVSDQVLHELGISFALDDAVPLTTSCWYHDGGPIRELRLRGRGISRHLLDHRLQARFRELGGRLVVNSRIQPGEGVVWAAGRRRTASDWIGLKAHFADLDVSHDLEMHAGDGGYVGLARIEDGKVNVCGLFRKRRIPGDREGQPLQSYLRECGLVRLADRLASAHPVKGSLCGVAGIAFGRTTAMCMTDTCLSIGDAAAMIPPFTGNGMSMALESAYHAMNPTLGFAQGTLSWSEAMNANNRLAGKAFAKRMALARLLHPLISHGGTAWFLQKTGIGRFLPFGLLYRSLR